MNTQHNHDASLSICPLLFARYIGSNYPKGEAI